MKPTPIFPNRKKIAIDARAISHPQPGGFKTYSENLVKQLLQRDEPFSYKLYVDRALSNNQIPFISDGMLNVVRPRGSFMGVPVREQISLPYHLAIDHVDLIHFPCATAALWTPCPYVITIHDTIELMSWSTRDSGMSLKRNLMHLYNRYNQILAARKAEVVLTVSQNSKRDIINHFNLPEAKVVVTYEAPDEEFVHIEDKGQLDEIKQTYKLVEPYILGIGSADPRKNLKCLIQAYSQLKTELIECYQLVIVMTHHRLQESLFSLVEKLGVTHRVKFLNAVPNPDLVFLYNGAALFVFPSLYEGFGLPPLEAMACGTPVVAANNSSIPEVVGDAALLFDAEDALAMAEKIACVLNDESLKIDLIQKGIAQAASFSWEKCALETIQVYKQAIQVRR